MFKVVLNIQKAKNHKVALFWLQQIVPPKQNNKKKCEIGKKKNK